MPKKGNIIAGVVAGALAGVAAGMLLAPKAGKESRRIVKDRAITVKNKAGAAAGAIRSRVRRNRQNNTLEARSDNQSRVFS